MSEDMAVLEYLLSTKYGPTILKTKEEAYGNTPLHIAVSLPAVSYAKTIFKAQPTDMKPLKNKDGQTVKETLN